MMIRVQSNYQESRFSFIRLPLILFLYLPLLNTEILKKLFKYKQFRVFSMKQGSLVQYMRFLYVNKVHTHI